MIEELKPYPDYQAVDSRWIQRAPKHWQVKKLRALTIPRSERNRPDLPLLSVARERGVFVRTDHDDNHNFVPDDLSNYKVARAGSLVINKMKAWQGSMGIAPTDGIVSPAYFVYDLQISNRMFGQALLRSRPYVAHFAQASDGVRVGQWDLSIDRMREIPIVLPSPEEQAAIVRFLDHANRRIDQFIRAKKKLIALLNEQKQAIIHRAVTRGLDPNVKLKDSGVPWLGEIPAHWEVSRLKRVCSLVRDGTHLPPPRTVTGYPLLSVRNVVGGRLVRRDDDSFVSEADFRQLCSSFEVLPKDVVLAIVGATLGKVAVVEDIGPFHIQRSLAVFRPCSHQLDAEYLAAFMRAPGFQENLWRSVAFSAQPGIYLGFLSDVPIVLPPLAAQQETMSALACLLAPVDAALGKTEREISLIREYRTRLISDVVTGQLDVRAAAASLPDVELEAAVLSSADEDEDAPDLDDGEDDT